jgi:RimJ/RimL family protein N-acetyltransferase
MSSPAPAPAAAPVAAPAPPLEFTTPRLVARPTRVADAPEIFAAYAADPLVTRYLSWRHHASPATVAEFLAHGERAWTTGAGHRGYALRLRTTGELVGSIGLEIKGPAVMFGYVLARQYWGNGYMPEALAHLVDWALAQPGVYRAWAFCDVDNPGSARVMEKAGMTLEGRLRRWHVCPELGDEPRDCWVYARVR